MKTNKQQQIISKNSRFLENPNPIRAKKYSYGGIAPYNQISCLDIPPNKSNVLKQKPMPERFDRGLTLFRTFSLFFASHSQACKTLRDS